MSQGPALGFPRAYGRFGCRNHLLVLPSVVCATRVAHDIAADAGGVAVVHQHGCSQIGNDEVQTATAFVQIACNPNVGAVLVVSLGCETVQGAELARAIGERGQRVEFVGIQDSGGSEAAVDAGGTLARRLAGELAAQTRVPIEPARMFLGIETSRSGEAAAALARVASESGASVVLGSSVNLPEELMNGFRTVAAFGEDGEGSQLALEGAGSAAEQHTALVAAGAQLVVSFPDDDAGPTGFPLCPIVSVAGGSPLHAALADDFDAHEPVPAEELWRRIVEVLSGRPSAAESLGQDTFALSRLARSM
jgi:altronate dehydratase